MAHEMMVPTGIGIEPGLGLRIAYLLGGPELYEGFKYPVDGTARNAGVSCNNCLVYLVRGRVVITTGKILHNHPTLESQGNPLGPAAGFKFVDFSFFKMGTRVHGMGYYCNR